jgi:hypothetical protein
MAKRGYVEISGVPDPRDGCRSRSSAWLCISDFNQVFKFSQFKAALLQAAQEVLRSPEAVFEAHRNVRHQEVVGFCFVGRPREVPDGQGGTRRLPPGRVVAVYVDKALNVWEWGLERSGDDPPRPAEPEARFGARLL